MKRSPWYDVVTPRAEMDWEHELKTIFPDMRFCQ